MSRIKAFLYLLASSSSLVVGQALGTSQADPRTGLSDRAHS